MSLLKTKIPVVSLLFTSKHFETMKLFSPVFVPKVSNSSNNFLDPQSSLVESIKPQGVSMEISARKPALLTPLACY